MSTYRKVEEMLKNAHELVEYADEQLQLATKQQPAVSDKGYTETQQLLERMSVELDKMIHSANPEQRDALSRAQQQVQDCQNDFILGFDT
ncbi:DUF2524 family protein [Bacillus sp. NTK071]|uniref:DUF2524 family protein n=1 Tax=Bacillus sp. NTK071 TaxID=2802175 RepID=UPI001A90A7C9|nr:DUF2524 family protein [Bacillus sp. NTK071]MBN8207606.1 DUF2524 family protein [Bacillus sp. NTK071]